MKTQHFHSPRGCLSYIVWDEATKQAALIDPSDEIGADAYLQFISENCLTLVYILETHTHADHVSLARNLREKTEAPIARHALAPSSVKDVALEGGEELALGSQTISVLATPGHTNESVSYYIGTEVFTGDALLIGGTGRTDFQVGDSETLYHTLHDVLGKLPSNTTLRPGHDYKGRKMALLSDEVESSPRFLMSKPEFIHFMDEYHPPKPELFVESIRKNSL